MMQIIKTITSKTNLSLQEAWWLIQAATQQSKEHLICNNYALTEKETQLIESWIQEIQEHHKPLAYILGWQPFLDLKISLQPPTLIPRPETEEWVEATIKMLRQANLNKLTILDIGTGSGCIALALAQALPDSHVYAIDISEHALSLAQKNALQNKITNVTFIKSDLFAAIPTDLKFDLIVSNPPYIPRKAVLQPSVLNWEDHHALFANRQGIDIIEQIIKNSQAWLQSNSLPFQLILEIDETHTNLVQKILQTYNFSAIYIKKDAFNKPRTVWVK